MTKEIALTPEIENILALNNGAVAAISISGGKDSSIAVLETNDYLDKIGFSGERLLVHSHLGKIEHAQSLEICEKLSAATGIRLQIVYPLREMIERWEYRWECLTDRFINLRTVRLSSPFSSAQNRFCTSEEKTAPICRFLKNSYAGKTILNITGIRRGESRNRASKPISEPNKLLNIKTKGTSGYTWLPLADFSLEDVFLSHKKFSFPLHEAYTRFGLKRVSCSFCVLAGEDDLRASLTDERNHDAFREIARLEAVSSFSFKENFWLSELAPNLLGENGQGRLATAKQTAISRLYCDRLIPEEMLFNKKTHFPAFQPDLIQSGRLGDARARLGDLFGLPVLYTSASDVYNRYAELLIEQHDKELRRRKTKAQPTTGEQFRLF